MAKYLKRNYTGFGGNDIANFFLITNEKSCRYGGVTTLDAVDLGIRDQQESATSVYHSFARVVDPIKTQTQ